MRLIFHVGLHRAASSSLQRLLGAEARSLARADIRVVRQQDRHLAEYQALRPLFGRHIGNADPDRVAADVEAALAAITPPVGTLLFSDENLLGPMLGRQAAAMPAQAAVLAALGELGRRHEVHVVLILREHVGWLGSLYRFQVGKGDTRSMQRFLGDVDLASIAFADLVRRAEAALGVDKVHVLAFESVTSDAGRDLLRRLGGLVGAPQLAGMALEHRNASPPAFLFHVLQGLVARNVYFAGGQSKELGRLAAQALVEPEPRATEVLDEIAAALAANSVWMPLPLRQRDRLALAIWLGERDRWRLLRGVGAADAAALLRQAHAAAGESRLPPLLEPATAAALWDRFAVDRAAITASRLPEWSQLRAHRPAAAVVSQTQ